MRNIIKIVIELKGILNTFAPNISSFSIKEDVIDICLKLKDTQHFWETGAKISQKLTMYEIFTKHHSILIHNEDSSLQIPIQKHTYKIFFGMDKELEDGDIVSEYRQKLINQIVDKEVIKRRKILDFFAYMFLCPLLIPLWCIYKLGELADKLADVIQLPYRRFKFEYVKEYRIKTREKIIKSLVQ